MDGTISRLLLLPVRWCLKYKEAGPLLDIELPIPISVKDFAVRINQKMNVVLKKLLNMGVFANINQNLG
jgi:hypothetical protein